MISAVNLSKSFQSIKAVDQVSLTIKDGNIFGIIGSNGAGKSTFLRMLAGIYKPDSGSVTIDGSEVFEHVAVKSRCFYISDEQYFFPNSTPLELKNYYKLSYPQFNDQRFGQLMRAFALDETRKIQTFSKGMKKQVSIICGVCAGTDYIFCDETFDGLDPVARQVVKSIFAEETMDRNLTPVIASHNLRELEDICDHVGLLHKGGVLLSRDLEHMKLGIHKIQCVFKRPVMDGDLADLDILKTEMRGSIYTLVARGAKEELEQKVLALDPIFFEVLPLSLEEIFINETEVAGYDIRKLLF